MEIIEKLLERANSGDSNASYKLGIYYETGNFVEQDYEKAVKWYITAIKQAENNQAYERLEVLQQKDLESKQFLLNSKRKISGIAYQYLGRFKLLKYFPTDTIIKRCYEKAIKYGNDKALLELAVSYMYGIGIKQDNKKAKWFLLKAKDKGDKNALLPLGCLCELEKDYKLAKDYYLQATKVKETSAMAFEYLGNLYLYGLGVEQDFKKANLLFKKALKNGNKNVLYKLDTFNKIGNKKIKVIESIAEFQDVEDDVGGILICPKYNLDTVSHSLYDVQTFCQIKKRIDELLADIPEVTEDKSNEFDVFKGICKKIAEKYSYDNEYLLFKELRDFLIDITDISLPKTNKAYLREDTTRNLIGVLNNSGVCSWFAEFLRNMCACRKIECINVQSKLKDAVGHAFVFVKIQGTWYPFDMTWMNNKIKNGMDVENMLVSQIEFEKESIDHIPGYGQYIPKKGLATTSYNTQALVRNALKSGVTEKSLQQTENYINSLSKKRASYISERH